MLNFQCFRRRFLKIKIHAELQRALKASSNVSVCYFSHYFGNRKLDRNILHS
uniref:Uncharacterized protein n=1 Tax=Rhizophora mucronata TaxID=61149 RepID=A0A2P2N726_RHIMU